MRLEVKVTERPKAEDELGSDGDAGAATGPEVPLEIDLDPSLPASAAAGGGQSDEEQVEGFVAESEPLGSDGKALDELDEDSPTIAMHTMRLLDPDIEDIDAQSTVRPRSVPPPPPRAAARAEPPLSNVVLGPDLSMRGEITERMNLIPSTHPMANSLAPGGSPLSAAPPRRPSLRWQVVLGALALVGLGAGASQYLQSWGEQHAAGVREGEQVDDAPAAAGARPAAAPAGELDEGPAALAMADRAPSDPPQRVDEPAAPSALSREQASAAQQPEGSGDDASATQPSVTSGAVPAAGGEALRTSAPVALKPRAIAATATPAASGRIRLTVGAAAIRPPPERPFRPTLGVVNTAIDGVRDQVRACVGDAHGVADVVLTVRSTGVISHALVQGGTFAGSAAGSCIARTLRGARIAPFRKPVVRILYPLEL